MSQLQERFLKDRLRDLFIKAFKLAFFICPDRERALQITYEAIRYLDLTSASQFKRRYYSLKGWLLENSERKKNRTKVHMKEEQLLQRLIYKIAQNQEPDPGRNEEIDEEGMLIRYLMQIVALTLKYNSFQVTVG